MLVCVFVMTLISINSMVIKALIGRHECRFSCQFGRGSSGERAINQSIKGINQCIILPCYCQTCINSKCTRCMLHVACWFYEFFDTAAAAISSKFVAGSAERGGVEEELAEGEGGAGDSRRHIDALHATHQQCAALPLQSCKLRCWHRNCFVASSASPLSPLPCPCLTVSSLFVLLANFGKILQLLWLRQLQS